MEYWRKAKTYQVKWNIVTIEYEVGENAQNNVEKIVFIWFLADTSGI